MISVLIWYLALFLTGIVFMPAAGVLFRSFPDRGYVFSRSIGLLALSFAIWVLNVTRVIKFNSLSCMAVSGIMVIIMAVIMIFRIRKGRVLLPEFRLVITEEILFAVLFFLWVYLIGFKAGAHGTEKFMDYGFITSVLNSDYMPFPDMWMSGHDVNYYYGGQFITAVLIRLTGVSAGEGYSLMRAFIASMSFLLPFSLVANLMSFRGIGTGGSETVGTGTGGTETAGAGTKSEAGKSPYLAGALAGLAAAFCGNLHYIIYGIILPVVYKIRGVTEYSYWFPRSTRYIGYDPDIPDKTIHEFPAYSTILGDLHAHYTGLIFTVSVIALAAAFILNRENTSGKKHMILCPEVILCGIITGLFRWINYWDLPICFVICISVFFVSNIRNMKTGKGIIVTCIQAAVMYAAGYAASLPFTLFFKNDYTSIGMTHSNTMPHQLAVLWGFPVVICLVFIVLILKKHKKHVLRQAPAEDIIICVLAVCAMGLVLLPELVYVKDIYGDDFYRANTMFKLTYQAFILFAVCMGYIIVRGIKTAKPVIKGFSAAALIILLITAGYTVNGVHAWFGNVLDVSERDTIDAASFIEKDFPEDAGAIGFLSGYEGETPVILEGTDRSYSDLGRVSVATGFPTVLGWYGHEQLWRGESEEVPERWHDVGRIYQESVPEEAAGFIDKYGVDLIYVGQLEHERYVIDDAVIKSLGDVVYEDGYTYIVETSHR